MSATAGARFGCNARAVRSELSAVSAELDPSLVVAHGLAPLAYKHGLDQFKTAYLTTALEAEVRKKILEAALQTLSDAQIPTILLKGMSDGLDLYDDPAESIRIIGEHVVPALKDA